MAEKGDKVCCNCRHWQKAKDEYYEYGECSEIRQKIDIMIDGDASVQLDIEGDFGCLFFKQSP
jgi:hypothetical protein